MKSLIKILVIILVSASFLLACKSQTNSPLSGSGREGTTIATVNGAPVTDEDVKFEISLLPDQLQEMAETGEGLATLIDDVLKKEMLYQEAKKKHIDSTDEYKHRLRDLERRLIVEILLIQEIEKNTTVSDEEARMFYEENLDKFVAPAAPGSKGKERPVPYEEVESLIKDRLLQQKQRKTFQDYVESLSNTYKVEIKNDAIAASFGISVEDKSNSEETPAGETMGKESPEPVTPEAKDAENSLK